MSTEGADVAVAFEINVSGAFGAWTFTEATSTAAVAAAVAAAAATVGTLCKLATRFASLCLLLPILVGSVQDHGSPTCIMFPWALPKVANVCRLDP